MEITTKRVKQYNSTSKTVILVDGEPICIVASGASQGVTISNIMAYLNGFDATINDGAIKKKLKELRTREVSKWD